MKSNTSNSNQKEWQFLQTAINEAGLTDFYQTYNDLANGSTVMSTQAQASGSSKFGNSSMSSSLAASPAPHQTAQLVTVTDLNIETILQMQCELLDQQKELKNIELETMDHLRQLHQNINRLASKLDSFELSFQGQNAPGSTNFNNVINNGTNISISQDNQSLNGLKAARNVFNKLNTTIGQQLKVCYLFLSIRSIY